MLKHLRLQNYRGFATHDLPLRPRTLIVGRNNAGKSTIIEALRLVALVSSRLTTATYRAPPAWLRAPGAARGIQPSLDRVEFDFATVQHHYDKSEPSSIIATFANDATIRIFVGSEGAIFATATDGDGRLIRDRSAASRLGIPPVVILPQIGPLAVEEEILTPEYVRRMQDTPLASLHFRNQLRLDRATYVRFRRLVEDSWPGVMIDTLHEARYHHRSERSA